MIKVNASVRTLPYPVTHSIRPIGTAPEPPPVDDVPYVIRNREWADGNLYFDALGSALAVEGSLTNHEGDGTVHFADNAALTNAVRNAKTWIDADTLYDALGSAQAVQGNLTSHINQAAIHFADVSVNGIRYNRLDQDWVPATVENNWESDATHQDLVPRAIDQGIGTLEKTSPHVAVGEFTPGAEGGIEGAIAKVINAEGGGLQVIGYRNDPVNLRATSTVEANAPLYLKGTAVALDGTVGVIVDAPVAKDHYLKVGPTVTLPNGQLFAPFELGPEIVYTNEETITDSRDIDLPDGVEVDLFPGGLTLANSYTTAAQYGTRVSIEETGGREVIFTLRYLLDDVPQNVPVVVSLNGNSMIWFDSGELLQSLSPGQVIRVTVQADNQHPQANGWIRGQSSLPSELTIHEVV